MVIVKSSCFIVWLLITCHVLDGLRIDKDVSWWQWHPDTKLLALHRMVQVKQLWLESPQFLFLPVTYTESAFLEGNALGKSFIHPSQCAEKYWSSNINYIVMRMVCRAWHKLILGVIMSINCYYKKYQKVTPNGIHFHMYVVIQSAFLVIFTLSVKTEPSYMCCTRNWKIALITTYLHVFTVAIIKHIVIVYRVYCNCGSD